MTAERIAAARALCEAAILPWCVAVFKPDDRFHWVIDGNGSSVGGTAGRMDPEEAALAVFAVNFLPEALDALESTRAALMDLLHVEPNTQEESAATAEAERVLGLPVPEGAKTTGQMLAESQARVRKLEDALKDCADDLESEINARITPEMRKYPCMQSDYEQEMTTVVAAREALRREE